MKLIKKKYEHYLNIDVDIDLDRVVDLNLYIVYFINCRLNKNYMEWVINDINLVKNYNAPIYLVATIEKESEENFRKEVLSLYPNINIECYYDLEFEYRGVLKTWELAQKYNQPNDIILYYMSRFITHYTNYKERSYNSFIRDFDKVKEIFTIFPSIDKVGLSTGGYGWCWMNFWYARGSCLIQNEKPVKSSRRHYYEDWLGRKVNPGDEICEYERSYDKNYPYLNTLETCYQFYTDKITFGNIGSFFCSETARYYTINDSKYNLYKKYEYI